MQSTALGLGLKGEAGVPKNCLQELRRLTERGRGLSKLVISRVIIRVTPFRALITLLITCLLSPLPLQVDPKP